MNKNNNIVELQFDPLNRFQPIFISIGLLLGHLIVVFLISAQLVKETWGQLLSSLILCTILLSSMTWLFYQGKNAWPKWDREFVHIPIIVMTIITVYWLYLLPEIREAILLTWLGLYPCIHGRITLVHYMLYSSNLSFIYLCFCFPFWADNQALFTSNFAFALSSLVLCFYLGLISQQERLRDKEFMASEKRLAAARKQLKHISEHDALTGLLNRRGLESHWHQDYNNVSMLVIDIDHFKLYNDHYGHPQGDICLKQVADLLKAYIGKMGCVSRYGGEEFVILLYNIEPHDVVNIAEKCCETISKAQIPHISSKVLPIVTISLGGWFDVDHHITLENLWELADKALYVAKKNGRNQVNIASRTALSMPPKVPPPSAKRTRIIPSHEHHLSAL